MNILFMGTPEFAEKQLRALYEHSGAHNWSIVGTLSQPDKPKGRGYQMIPTPVKVYAQSVGIPVYQPDTLASEEAKERLTAFAPDLIVVAAYGKILPRYVLDLPKYGCINVHGSLLPAYRGAAPIQRAIMDGLRVTGNTIQYMADGIDTGDIIGTCEVEIGENENFGSLYERMADAGAALLIRVIEQIESGTAVRLPQRDEDATYAKKISKEECALDFSDSAVNLHNKIRALSPAPLAYAHLWHDNQSKTVKPVSSVVVESDGEHGIPGTVLHADDKRGVIEIACSSGILGILELVPEGKGRMRAGDFIRGRKIAAGDRLE